MTPCRSPIEQHRAEEVARRVRGWWAPKDAPRRPAPITAEQLEETRARVAVDFPVLSEEAIAICTRGREE